MRTRPAAPRPQRPWTARLLAGAALACVLVLGAACGDSYPPALMAATAPPEIRVRLGQPRAEATLRVPAQPWTIRSVGGQPFALDGRIELSTTLRVGATGISLRGRDTGATTLRFRPAASFTLDDRVYRGSLIVTVQDRKLVLVNELDLENYVAGVIGNEVGPNAAPATYRAQSVAARTYAWIKLHTSGADDATFHLYDSAASQVYTGMSPPAAYGIHYPDMVTRTAETRGVIVTHGGRPFRAYYASTCGGHTTEPETSGLDAGGAHEPLRGVPCAHCTTSKYFRWTKRLTDAEVVAGMKQRKLPVTLPIRAISIMRRGRGGWVAEGEVRHGPDGKARSIPGHEMRSALGLRSNNIDKITRVRGGWVIEGRGWGHGVGMCQWGAIEMGHKGASETEILRYYYPGIEFTKVY